MTYAIILTAKEALKILYYDPNNGTWWLIRIIYRE
jgi:hypothetical protein